MRRGCLPHAAVFAALLCLAAMPALAADYSSVTSGDWNDPATWGEVDYPVAGDKVTINDGHIVTIAAPAAAATVEILAGGELADSGTPTLVVSGDLTNHGSITRSRTALWTVGATEGDFANHGGYSHIGTGGLTIAEGDFRHSGVWSSTHSGAAVSVPNGTFTFSAGMVHAGAITVGLGDFAIAEGLPFDRAGGTGSLMVSSGNFSNAGTWLSTGTGGINVPNGSFTFSTDMVHTGAISIGQGGLTIPAGVTFNRLAGAGAITIADGNFLNLGSYNHTGTGGLTVSNGNFSQSGSWLSTGTGVINVPNGGFTLVNSMTHTGAMTIGQAGLTIPEGRILNRVGGAGNVTVANGDFVNNGDYQHTGTGNLTISTGNFVQSGGWSSTHSSAALAVPAGTFTLGAEMLHAGGITVGLDGFTIPAGLTLDRLNSTGAIVVTVGDFINNGSYLHTGGGNLTVTKGDFVNNGYWNSTGSGSVIAVTDGAFTMNADMRQDGISLGVGNLVIPTDRALNRGAGGGLITVSNGNFVNNGSYLHTGSGNLTVTRGDFINNSSWSSTGAGSVIVVSNGAFTMNADMEQAGITLTRGNLVIPDSLMLNRRTGTAIVTVSNGHLINRGIYRHTGTGNVVVSDGNLIQTGEWASTNQSAAISLPAGTIELAVDMSHAGAVTVGLGGFIIPAGITYIHTGAGAVGINGGMTVNGTLRRTGTGVFTINTGNFVNNGECVNTSSGNLVVSTGSFHNAGTWSSTNSGAAVSVPNNRFTLAADMTQAGPVTIGLDGLTIPTGVSYTHSGTGAVSISGGVTVNGSLRRAGTGVFTINTGNFVNNGLYSNTSTGDLIVTNGGFINGEEGEIVVGTSTAQNWQIGGSFTSHQDDPEKVATPLGTTTFGGFGESEFYSAAPLKFRNLTLNKPSGSLTLTSDLLVETNCLLTAGTFDINGQTLTLGREGTGAGNLRVAENAVFKAVGSEPGNGWLAAEATSGGKVTAAEEAANRAYVFTVEGRIAARNATFERMNASGIKITGNGVIADSPYNFTDCTFDYGTDANPMLWVDRALDSNVAIFRVAFRGGNPNARNIRKSAVGTGRIIVTERAGALWGEEYELDPNGPNPDGLIDWVQHDVAVTAIFAPVGEVDSGRVVTPTAVVRNVGTFEEVFPVYFTIGDDYTDSALVTLAAGKADTLEFTDWIAAIGQYEVTCWTALDRDMDPSNDRMVDTVTVPVPVHDVGVTAILAPAGEFELGDELTPMATVHNFGSHPATFPVVFRVADVYADTQEVTLAPGALDTLSFSLWTAGPVGRHVVSCSTMLANDQEPGNNAMRDTIEVMETILDVAATTILAPVDSIYYDSTVTPRAVVKSHSNVPVTFPVVFRIGAVYADTQQVTLAPGAEDTLSFSAWTAGPLGRHAVSCSTMLEGDRNPGNDAVRDTIEVIEDVGIAEENLPVKLEVSRVAPNPLARLGSVRLALPAAERVSLKLYDAVGRQARVLADGPMPAGRHILRLDASDLAEGVYLLKAEIGEYNSTQKLVVQR